jgi:hypothetical protein
MRDDEFMWEPFGSAMIMKMRAGLDAQGRIVDWEHELWSYPHTTRPGGREGVNLHYEEVEGAVHDEGAWATRLDRILIFLLGPPRR